MTVPQEPLRWKNASSGDDTCVDLAHTGKAVRDSKNPTTVLAVDVAVFLSMVSAGQFDG